MKTKISLSLLAILMISSVSGAVTASNLLAYYNFNGNTDDSSGNGANGTLMDSAAISGDGAGASGNAGDSSLDLGASGGAARMESMVDLSSATSGNALAVSFWQYDIGNGQGGNAASSAFGLVSSVAADSGRGFSAHTPWSDGNLYFDHAGCCADPQRINGAVGLDLLDGWHHIVMQVDNGERQVWLDGEPFLTDSGVTTDITEFTNLAIIGAQFDATNSFGGRIDEFAIWNTSLNEGEIKALAGGSSANAILVPEPTTGLMALLGSFFLLRRKRF